MSSHTIFKRFYFHFRRLSKLKEKQDVKKGKKFDKNQSGFEHLTGWCLNFLMIAV